MLFGFEPVLGNGENGGAVFWVIITIFVVISQALKAHRQKSGGARQPGAQPPNAAKAEPSDPSDELQRFLQNLTGNTQPQQAKPATPVAPPPVPRQRQSTAVPRATTAGTAVRRAAYAKAQPVSETARQRPAAKKAASPAPPPSTKDVWAKPTVPEFRHAQHAELFAANPDPRQTRARQFRQGLGDALIGKDHLRQAIALKEILGPPLGLRTPAQSQP